MGTLLPHLVSSLVMGSAAPTGGEEVSTPDCLRRTTNSPYQQPSPQHDLESWTHLGSDHGLLLTAVEVWQALVTTILSPVTMEVLE